MSDLEWDQTWADIDGEAWLAAKALLELSPALRRDAIQWMSRRSIDWDGWIASVDEDGRGWSSSERRLFEIVAALVAEEPRAVPIRGLLDNMGSWENDVWRILVNWGTGGNNRDLPGRAALISQL